MPNPIKIAIVGARQSGKTCLLTGLYASKKFAVVNIDAGKYLTDLKSQIEDHNWPSATNVKTKNSIELMFMPRFGKPVNFVFEDYAGETIMGTNAFVAQMGDVTGIAFLFNPGMEAMKTPSDRNELQEVSRRIATGLIKNGCKRFAVVITASDRIKEGGDLANETELVRNFNYFIEEFYDFLNDSKVKTEKFECSITGKLESQDNPSIAHGKDNTSSRPFLWLLKSRFDKLIKTLTIGGACALAASLLAWNAGNVQKCRTERDEISAICECTGSTTLEGKIGEFGKNHDRIEGDFEEAIRLLEKLSERSDKPFFSKENEKWVRNSVVQCEEFVNKTLGKYKGSTERRKQKQAEKIVDEGEKVPSSESFEDLHKNVKSTLKAIKGYLDPRQNKAGNAAKNETLAKVQKELEAQESVLREQIWKEKLEPVRSRCLAYYKELAVPLYGKENGQISSQGLIDKIEDLQLAGLITNEEKEILSGEITQQYLSYQKEQIPVKWKNFTDDVLNAIDAIDEVPSTDKFNAGVKTALSKMWIFHPENQNNVAKNDEVSLTDVERELLQFDRETLEQVWKEKIEPARTKLLNSYGTLLFNFSNKTAKDLSKGVEEAKLMEFQDFLTDGEMKNLTAVLYATIDRETKKLWDDFFVENLGYHFANPVTPDAIGNFIKFYQRFDPSDRATQENSLFMVSKIEDTVEKVVNGLQFLKIEEYTGENGQYKKVQRLLRKIRDTGGKFKPLSDSWCYTFAIWCFDGDKGGMDAKEVFDTFPMTIQVDKVSVRMDYNNDDFPVSYKVTEFDVNVYGNSAAYPMLTDERIGTDKNEKTCEYSPLTTQINVGCLVPCFSHAIATDVNRISPNESFKFQYIKYIDVSKSSFSISDTAKFTNPRLTGSAEFEYGYSIEGRIFGKSIWHYLREAKATKGK